MVAYHRNLINEKSILNTDVRPFNNTVPCIASAIREHLVYSLDIYAAIISGHDVQFSFLGSRSIQMHVYAFNKLNPDKKIKSNLPNLFDSPKNE
jgi:hypothetical protein